MKISNNCYAVLGLGYIPPWSVNAGFITGAVHTLIVDTGPAYFTAQTILGYAAAIKPSNKIAAINTEKHLDHIGGNSFLRDKEIDIYGHFKINRNANDLEPDLVYYNQCIIDAERKAAREENIFFADTKIVNPNVKITGNTELDLGDGIKAQIILTPGHTETNLSVYEPETNVLYCGDCIVNRYLPNLADGNETAWNNWLASLDIIEQLNPDFVVPGHGDVLNPYSLKNEINRMRTILSSAIKRGVI
jgi:Zn-dependent hydrolases, including glyoxylases